MKLSILIVNWNTRDLAVRCIHSVLKTADSLDYEIIVVDNDSQDGSFEALQNLFGYNPLERGKSKFVASRRIKILEASANLGFAKAVNYAYKHSSGEYILLLNPDAEVRDSSLQKLVNYLDTHADAGIVGPKLVNPDGTLQRSVRQFPKVWSSIVVFSGLHRFFRPRKYLMDDFDYGKEGDVDQVMGAALMTRRKIVEELGFMDEKFWLWYEEVDFCKRVKEAGYKVRFYPGAIMMHQGARSFRQVPVYVRKKTVAKSLMYYFRKNGGILDIMIIRAGLPVVLFTAWFFGVLEKTFGLKIKPHV